MGYFSNGAEGMDYQNKWCDRCLHDNYEKGVFCPVWGLHLMHGYTGSPERQAALDELIPRTKDGLGNERCKMFVDRGLMSNLQIERYEYNE